MKFNYRVSNTNTTINRMLIIQGELSYAETWLYQRLFPLELKHQFLLVLEAINVNSSIPAKNLLFSYATPCFFSKATTCKISALLENWQDIAILIFIEGCSWNIGKVTLNDQEVFFFSKATTCKISALLETAILIFIEGCSWNIGEVTLNDQGVLFFFCCGHNVYSSLPT